MPKSVDGDPNQTSKPSKPERPPLLKRSKTVSETRSSATAAVVRRTTTSLASSFRPLNRTADDCLNNNNGFSDRDWTFPSFLGPHPSRNRATVKPVKSPSSKPKLDLPRLPPRCPPQSPQPPDSGTLVSKEKKKRATKEEEEEEGAKLVRSISSTSSVTPLRKVHRFDNQLLFFLVRP